MAALSRAALGALVMSGASTACGFAAIGVALHPQQLVGAGLVFAAVGWVTGTVRMALPMAFNQLPAQARLAAGQAEGEALSPLAAMARATLATMQQPPRRAAAPGPAAAPTPATVPAPAPATDTVGA
jgi:hypothetical protein